MRTIIRKRNLRLKNFFHIFFISFCKDFPFFIENSLFPIKPFISWMKFARSFLQFSKTIHHFAVSALTTSQLNTSLFSSGVNLDLITQKCLTFFIFYLITHSRSHSAIHLCWFTLGRSINFWHQFELSQLSLWFCHFTNLIHCENFKLS